MLSLYLLAVVVTVSSTEDERIGNYPPIWPPQPQDRNATSVYNPVTERCCKGKVHEGSSGAPLQCCESEIRDKSAQLCCDGVVHELKVGSLCCGNQTYNTKESICCNNQVVKLPDGTKVQDASCCDQTAYDTKNQLCCYDPKTHQQVAVKKNNADNNRCCGLEPFSTKTHVCCYTYGATDGTTNTLVAKEGNKSTCCDTKLYDYRTELCCGKQISRKTSNTQFCCGPHTYDRLKQVCCYAANPAIVLDKQSETDQCCGNQTYNRNTQLCCVGRVVENKYGNLDCCGKYAVNFRRKVCCYAGTPRGVLKSNKKDDRCCGSKPYYTKEELCCFYNGTQEVVKKAYPNDNQCCIGQSYQPEILIGGCSVNNKQCCGAKSIDPSTSYCCGTTEVNFTNEKELSCCGHSSNALTFNRKTQLCCYDYSNPKDVPKIVERKDGDACCGGKVYNSSVNIRCCKGNLLESEAGEGCCGEKLYNSQSQVCCGGKIIEKKDENSQCCYNSNTDEDQDCERGIYPYNWGIPKK